MTPEQAADFVNRYCNVGRDAQDLLNTKPTWPQLIAARGVGHRAVDTALAVLRVHHGIEHEENFLAAEYDAAIDVAAKQLSDSIDQKVLEDAIATVKQASKGEEFCRACGEYQS